MQAFYDIPVGATPADIVKTVGEPYSVHKQPDGTVEYEYIERIKVGYRDLQERRYYIILKDGAVVSKRVEQSSPLPYGFDSYDMQTTQNGNAANPQEKQINRWEIEKKAAIKAIKDPGFRRKLKEDPINALTLIDKSISKGVNVKVVEEKENEWVLAIPFHSKQWEQLSEIEIEKLFAGTIGGGESGPFGGC